MHDAIQIHEEPYGLFRLPDGRSLAFAESGATDGLPVVFFHGVPGSRFYWSFADDGSRTSNVGLHVVAFDRPGIGGSSPEPSRTLTSAAEDVAALVDACGWSRFGVIGFSGGAGYALACAAVLPERVAAIALVAPMADLTEPSVKASLDPVVRRGVAVASRCQAFLQSSVITRLDAARFLCGGADVVWSSLPSSDRRLLSRPNLREATRRVLEEAAAQGLEGPRLDAEILGRPWEFDLGDIDAPVSVHVGGADPWSTDAMAHWLRSRIGRASLHRYPGEGHFTVLVKKLPKVLEILRSDLERDMFAFTEDSRVALLAEAR